MRGGIASTDMCAFADKLCEFVEGFEEGWVIACASEVHRFTEGCGIGRVEIRVDSAGDRGFRGLETGAEVLLHLPTPFCAKVENGLCRGVSATLLHLPVLGEEFLRGVLRKVQVLNTVSIGASASLSIS